MLAHLTIKNLILVREASVEFQPGFTVITGETGGGKTAFIAALKLVLGERADPNKVGRHGERALIAATFDLLPSPSLIRLLEDAGIEHSFDEPLIITREVRSNGKSRALIGGQPATATLLQQIAPHLVDFVGQHAQIELKKNESQLALLDRFASLSLLPFQEAWKSQKVWANKLNDLAQKKGRSDQECPLLQQDLEALQELEYQPNEETSLFEEHARLANAEEIRLHTETILQSSEAALEACRTAHAGFEALLLLNLNLTEESGLSKEALLQLDELSRSMQSFQASLIQDPARLDYLNTRLEQIAKYKKRYGENLVQATQKLEEELSLLENLDQEIVACQKHLDIADQRTQNEALKLHNLRKQKGIELSQRLTEELVSLNMPDALITCQVTRTERTSTGEDHLEVLLRANPGHPATPIKESSSGGELSRLLLAIKCILHEEKEPPTQIFDEIDANVGGQSAAVLAEKLAHLAQNRQLICITHFPQVAARASHHLQVAKTEQKGTTESTITTLRGDEKSSEIDRMLGKGVVKSGLATQPA